LKTFEKSYCIHLYETAPNGKLSLHSLFNYFQDIASDHAEELGYGRNDLLEHNSFWVLSRMYSQILKLPEWEDEILIKTWPNGTDKLFALRNYQVSYPDGEVLAYAVSSWLILDRATKKIQRPESFFSGHNIPGSEQFAIRNPTKLETRVEQGQTDHCFRIKASDLDINLHTNNAVYLKWISDSYDLGFLRKNAPQSIEINYLAESKYDEEVTIRTASDGGICFDHSICRLNDGKEFCRVRMVWNKF
jgi:medium-chain acyl-[acyl-carrier-protein] hydrolase